MTTGESTSARLRRVERERDGAENRAIELAGEKVALTVALREAKQAFAASQADLSRVEGVCKLAKRRAAGLEEALSRAGAAHGDAITVVAQQARDLLAAWKERDLARAELVTARAELERLRATTHLTEGAHR